ncbi:MAG: hypothetical protein H6719_16380 [Sandaracinaceae bacterium]|nr:hypothetical protein [Sandaracinaceae bacterium]
MAVGFTHTCALVEDMGVWCFGQSGAFPLGSPSNEPTPVPGLPADLMSITAGTNHDCALDSTGAVLCWGANGSLQCAVEGSDGAPPLSTAVVAIDGVPPSTQLSANGQSTCAVTREGEVFCWGADDLGQTGQGPSDESPRPPRLPGRVADVSDAVAVSVGLEHACALDRSGVASCWGANSRGELGVAPSELRDRPLPVPGLPPLVQISAGQHFTCAVDVASSVWCWGDVPDRLPGATPAPAVVDGLSTEQVYAGFLSACALDSSRRVWCWGRAEPDYGFFPDPVDEPTDFRTPRLMTTLRDVAELATSALSWHSCARTDSGAVLCWGRNTELQLGRPRARYGAPDAVPSLP